MSNEQLIDRIAEIPGNDGWWKVSSQETFESVAFRLIGAGMRAEEVIDLLTEVYAAVSDEFGV